MIFLYGELHIILKPGFQTTQECPECGEKVIVSAEGALRYDRTLQDLVHLLVPRVLQTELKREHEFNTSLRRISLEGGLWHNRKLNLWKNEQARDPQIRIQLINHQTRADKVYLYFLYFFVIFTTKTFFWISRHFVQFKIFL